MTTPARDPGSRPEWVDWVTLAQQGDAAAYGRLVEHFWDELVRLARGVLGHRGDDEDVVQDSLIAAWPRLSGLREPASFAVWLRQIVVRRAWRRARWRFRFLPLPDYQPEWATVSDPDLRLDLAMLVARLPARQRAVVFLTEVEGWADPEAAACLGIETATLRVHRHRAHRALRARLEEIV
jgi:RNA polymerase sigma-70 factor (ECF subfamily)